MPVGFGRDFTKKPANNGQMENNYSEKGNSKLAQSEVTVQRINRQTIKNRPKKVHANSAIDSRH